MESKVCTKCGVEYPATVEWFYRKKTSKDGFQHYCKKCKIKDDKEYRAKNKNKLSVTQRKYRENHKAEALVRMQNWRENNRERWEDYFYKYRRSTYEKNKEYFKEKGREYREKYPERGVMKTQKRDARKASLPSTLTLLQWQETKNHFNHECAYCGKHLKNLAQEHVIPLSKGGGYTKDNIIPSCQSCNSSKGAKDLLEWYPAQAQYSEDRLSKINSFINNSIMTNNALKEARV